MRQIFGVLLAFTLMSCEANSNSLGTSKTICGITLTDFIEIIISNTDAGETTKTAYKITREGIISRAEWKSAEQALIGLSANVDLGQTAYTDALNVLSDLTLSYPPDDGTLAQPGGINAMMSFVSDGNIDFQSGSIGINPLLPLLETWRNATPFTSEINGSYYWGIPIGENQTATLDAEALGCDHPLSDAVVTGIFGSEVIRRAPEELTTFINEQAATRPVNIVSSPVGLMYIGFMTAP